MAELVIVGGGSGSGKSTSLGYVPRTKGGLTEKLGRSIMLQPTTKSLWRYNPNDYLGEMVQIQMSHDGTAFNQYPTLKSQLKEISRRAKFIIMDDMKWLMGSHYQKIHNQVGFGKFTEIGFALVELNNYIMYELPSDCVVIQLYHTDPIVSDGVIVGHGLKLFGKLVENDFNPIELVSLYLHTVVKPTKDNASSFHFATGSYHDETVGTINAKTPYNVDTNSSLFDLIIPNNMGIVLEKLGYYTPPTQEEIDRYRKDHNIIKQ
jgi:hypothetical protein